MWRTADQSANVIDVLLNTRGIIGQLKEKINYSQRLWAFKSFFVEIIFGFQ